MKKLLVFFCGLLVFALNAADIVWQVKVGETFSAKDAQKASVDGIMPHDSKIFTTKGGAQVNIHRLAGRHFAKDQRI